MICPVCGSNNTGKVGSDEYYCANCLLEFSKSGRKTQYFYIDEEGSSVLLKNKTAAKKMAAMIQSDQTEGTSILKGKHAFKVY
ncbi:MAG TPA: hypothetical protein GXZ24_07070 [Firmicutes bacterium]|nr:hypothetical protein [Bacillota bacterium]